MYKMWRELGVHSERTIRCFEESRMDGGQGITLLNGPLAQLDRALVCGTRGHRFESCGVRQNRLTFILTESILYRQ